MNKLSVFQVVLLIIFGMLGIAGVLIFAFATAGNNTTSAGPVLIWGEIDSKALNAVLGQAADQNQDFDQVKYVEKDPVTYESELVNALADGSGPDLFILRQDYLLHNAARITPIPTASLSPSQFNTMFIDAAGVFADSRGALGIPIVADPLVLYWNKDTLSQSGYAKPPATWAEVESMGEKFQKRDDSGAIVKSAIALGEYANVTNAKEILGILILQAGGDIVTRDSAGRLVPGLLSGGTGSGQTAESALRFYTEFANPSSSHYSWNRSLPESQRAFAAGVIALYIGFGSERPVIARMNPNLNFAVAAVPQIENGTHVVDTAHIYGISISRTAKNQPGALRVALQFASTATGMGKNLSTALGIPSALRDVLALPASGTGDLYKREALISRSWYDPDPAKTSGIFRAMIESITSGSLSLSDAVQRANQELGQILGI
ncbi:MAG: extracellular solute-binding protein [bacterium]|nr:extracellular solute-binding protein [bacterium]